MIQSFLKEKQIHVKLTELVFTCSLAAGGNREFWNAEPHLLGIFSSLRPAPFRLLMHNTAYLGSDMHQSLHIRGNNR
jgi:hypothetical protein